MGSVRMRVRVTGWIALLVALGFASSAGALDVTIVTLGTVGANTGNLLANTGNPRTQVASSTGVTTAPNGPVSDTIGELITFQARYAWLVASDRDGPGNATLTQNATAEYQLQFTVDNPAGTTYQVSIDTLRAGSLSLFDDDATGGATASATLGAVTGSLDSNVDPALALPSFGAFSGGSTGTSSFSQSGTTLTITDSALLRTFTLHFTWTGSATSSKDEGALRMGIAGSLTGPTTADNYPGVGLELNDGHFVTVSTQIIAVPEPQTTALIALGLLALAVRSRRAGRS